LTLNPNTHTVDILLVCIRTGRWLALQDIRSLQSFIALVNHPGIASPICIAHTFAIRLYDFCTTYDPSPAFLSYAIHHTILVMPISRKGQVDGSNDSSFLLG